MTTAGAEDKPGFSETGRSGQSWPAIILAALAGLYTAFLARQLLIPIAFSLFLYFLLVPLVRVLRRAYLPRPLAAVVVIGALLLVVVAGASELAGPVEEWNTRIPDLSRQLEEKYDHWRQPFDAFSRTAERIEKMTTLSPQPARPVLVERRSLLQNTISLGKAFLGGVGFSLLFLYLLFVFGDELIDEVSYRLQSSGGFGATKEVLLEVERNLSFYLTTITGVNAAVALAETLALYLLGVPNPLLWGLMTGILKFVPYVGTIVGTATMALVAVVTAEEPWTALAIVGVYYGVAVFDSIFVTPVLLGRQFRINPVIIFTWAALWGWLWGPAGVVIAVPLLVSLKITWQRVRQHDLRIIVVDRVPRDACEEAVQVEAGAPPAPAGTQLLV